MNTQLPSVSSTWTALVFGAVFNVLTAKPDDPLIYFTIKTVIGGAIWLGFQLLADHLKQQNAKQNNDEHKNSDQNKSK